MLQLGCPSLLTRKGSGRLAPLANFLDFGRALTDFQSVQIKLIDITIMLYPSDLIFIVDIKPHNVMPFHFRFYFFNILAFDAGKPTFVVKY